MLELRSIDDRVVDPWEIANSVKMAAHTHEAMFQEAKQFQKDD